jgi:hypothetical protein
VPSCLSQQCGSTSGYCRAFQLLTLSIAFVLAFCGYVHHAQLARVGSHAQVADSAIGQPLTPGGVYTGK